MVSASENQWSLHSGERESYRKLKLCFRRPCAQTHSFQVPAQRQQAERAWIIWERSVLTNFRAWTRKQVSGGSFSRKKALGHAIYLTFTSGGTSLVCSFCHYQSTWCHGPHPGISWGPTPPSLLAMGGSIKAIPTPLYLAGYINLDWWPSNTAPISGSQP